MTKVIYLRQINNLKRIRKLLHSVQEVQDNVTDIPTELDERRGRVNKVVIGTSVSGIIGGILTVVGIALTPVTFGASLGLSIAGAAVGVGSGALQGGFRVHEAVKQNKSTKEINEKVKETHDDLCNCLKEFHELFETERMLGNESIFAGINIKGFLSVVNVLRVSHGAAGIAISALKVSATAATASAAVLGPLGLIVDTAFLTEAVYDIAKRKNKTEASRIIQCCIACYTLVVSKYAGHFK